MAKIKLKTRVFVVTSRSENEVRCRDPVLKLDGRVKSDVIACAVIGRHSDLADLLTPRNCNCDVLLH